GYVDAQSLAAVVIEPVLGEGGFVPAPAEFLRAVRAFCDQTGAVLIVDEVQTGFARTGTTFAIEQAQVTPDLLVLAKSIAAGLPLSAVVGRAELLDAVQPGGLGGTYGGNPVACAAALASMETMDDQALADRARVLGARIETRLTAWAAAHPEQMGDVRGVGAMRAVELVLPGGTEPDSGLASAWSAACRKHGVVVLTAGVLGNVVRLLPPLVIDEATLDEALDRMEQALAEVLP
ncbi:MAG: aminotransferase class III-fold pyridoxal phosphate-dependent enzyme, partial [Myxococcota bacterium]|nr:aminotransferase class III-fold pyridoxal phosphate-dependent enzyme [Myxococcota bacterium]